MPRSAKKPARPAGQGTKATSSGPPPPFKYPPADLKDNFLSALDPSHVYITHIDVHPADFKRRVYTVPILMNLIITLVLLIRGYFLVPQYFSIFVAAFGHKLATDVDVYQATWWEIISVIIKRAILFLFDYTLYTLLIPWPYNFCFGTPGNPVKWRRSVGFRSREIIVRQSRKWDQTLSEKWMTEDEETVKQKIMPALDKTLVQKTGYLLLDQDWDLDYAAMVTAHKLIDSGKLAESTFEKTVFVHYAPAGGWIIWDVHAEDTSEKEPAREKILQFQEKLASMGKENLFFRWVEIVQYESTQPGGFTPARQQSAMAQARKLFQENGVDFEAFWKEVGGMEGMEGVEGSSTTTK